MTGNARRVAWLVVLLGIVGAGIGGYFTYVAETEVAFSFSMTQLFWLGIVYIAVGLIVLLLIRGESAPESSARATRPAAGSHSAVDPQDLTLIEGIGPKSKEALNRAGIYTFTQLLERTPEDLLRIVRDEGGVQVVGNATATWTKQARYIVNGDLEGLKRYQEILQAGRE
ncbi:MAG: hypothetical protein Kow0077_16950 [Anaerolineae bacterium]